MDRLRAVGHRPAPIDEVHIRGREATLELAPSAGLDAHERVLDLGSGVGGASRCLAAEFGCRVTGIDLTTRFCQPVRQPELPESDVGVRESW